MAGALSAAFSALLTQCSTLASESDYCACSVDCCCNAYLGCSRDGRPAVFVRLMATGGVASGVSLENIRVAHRTACRLQVEPGLVATGPYTVVECLSQQAPLHRVFLDAVEDVLARVSPSTTPPEFDRHLNYLVDLFRAIAIPRAASWLGLWGELLVIHSSRAPCSLLGAWHAEPESLHDFAEGQTRLEVKTSSTGCRAHQFSLSQLCPPAPSLVVYVVSVLATETIAGRSVGELASEIRRRVSANRTLVRHLDTQLAAVLGSAFGEKGPRFDYESALATIRVFRAVDVPKALVQPGDPVDHVSFRSTLDERLCWSAGLTPAPPLLAALRLPSTPPAQ